MDEMYILHELQGDDLQEIETSQEPAPELDSELISDLPDDEPPIEEDQEPTPEPTHEPEELPVHNLEFVPIEEPGPNWEMELAQAYVRSQPLEGIFPPEEGLRMGTAFPNLSQRYSGRR